MGMGHTEQLFPFESSSEAETRHLGRRFGGVLSKGDIVALVGDLGAGKTQFVKGVASHFGVDERDVSSPTFTIAHEYQPSVSKLDDDTIRLVHMDLYRLKNEEEVFGSGIEDYLHSGFICLIEWPERAGHLLPASTHIVKLSHLPRGKRLIEYRRAQPE